MFKKEKKLEVKSNSVETKIPIKILPLVKIDEIEVSVNGTKQAPKFKIHIAERDLISLDRREYVELFKEMMRSFSSNDIIHIISEVHNEQHQESEKFMGGLSEFLAQHMPKDLADILKRK